MSRRKSCVSKIVPLFLVPLGSQHLLNVAAASSKPERSRSDDPRKPSTDPKGKVKRMRGSNRQRAEKTNARDGTRGLEERAWSAADIIEGILNHADQVKAQVLETDEMELPGRSSEWMGIQSGSGYVFARRSNLKTVLINSPKAALAKILPRDSHLVSPPWVPNSSSRLLIELIITCIITVGIVTFLLQELLSRRQPSTSSTTPTHRRRRSSESYFTGPANHRTVPTGGVPLSPDLPPMSVEEEEEQILTPPIISRRSSARSIHQEEQDDTDDDDSSSVASSRKAGQDLHYYALPFGLGVGYSYGPINDRIAARARLDRITAARKHNQSQSSIVASLTRPSSPTLPIAAGTSTSAFDSTSALRSRARTFKDICKGAIGVGSSSSRNEETLEDWPNTSDLSDDAPTNGIPLDNFTLLDLGASSSTETVTPYAIPSARVSSPPSPGAAAGIARHPLVEHLRREGRSDNERRVGKGTPTIASKTPF